MILATNIAFGLLGLAVLLAVYRVIVGPSIADRVVAADLFLTFLVMGAALQGARTGEGDFFEAMLVVAVVGFLGTSMVARFIERRGA